MSGSLPRVRRVLPPLVLVLVVGGFVAASYLRGDLPGELSAEALRDWVLGLGWRAPAIYTAVVAFRLFLFLPTWLVLAAGGLCFDLTLGTLLGGAGLFVSALWQFGVARAVGREWVRPYLGDRITRAETRLGRLGALLVGFVTAHPLGPLSPFHLAAGLSSLAVSSFTIAMLVATPIRSFTWAAFGSALLDPGSPRFLATTAVLLGVGVLPLLHPRVRATLFGAERGRALFPESEDRA
jgi:uncharacterized membrane protein YdjX (TVP38/TMEM64 family)